MLSFAHVLFSSVFPGDPEIRQRPPKKVRLKFIFLDFICRGCVERCANKRRNRGRDEKQRLLSLIMRADICWDDLRIFSRSGFYGSFGLRGVMCVCVWAVVDRTPSGPQSVTSPLRLTGQSWVQMVWVWRVRFTSERCDIWQTSQTFPFHQHGYQNRKWIANFVMVKDVLALR